ncbi:MAG: META domain-containing protein [Caldilineaceae bacterium]|nr:META domain-containing protein [Caldilineaceae bacterium]
MLRNSRAVMAMVALGALMLLSACNFTIQPEAERSEATPAPQAESGSSEARAIAEFVLPDGTSCLFAGTGVTVAFDDKRVNYTCEPINATEGTTTTYGILDDPVVAGPTEYAVDLATIGQTEGGFELHASEVISFTAWEVVLADGRVCLHAGFGATMGFEGQRLNYTCDKGESSADEVGLMGELVNQGDGVWMAQIDEIDSDTSGFTQLSSTQVAVARVSGMEVTPGAASEAAPETTDMSSELIGTTWQWVQTVYGDDSVVAAADPGRYTLLFDETGQVAVRLDCNGGGGQYTVEGSSLLFGALVSTLMACPEDSQATVFAKDLAEVYSYVIEGGHLYLSLKLDTGTMEFVPAEEGAGAPTVEATEEPTEEATMEPTAEATAEATEEATMEPTEEATAEPTEEATEEATEEPTAEATEEPAEEASAGAGSGELVGTSWQWVQSVYEGDMAVIANDPTRYTITFNDDGSVQAQIDCNSGRGTYTVDGSNLTFGAITSTRMACPSDSQDGVFAADLAAVTSYLFADGNLHLTTSTDGVMEFAPAE